MAVRNFNEAEKQKLIQIISQGSQVLSEVDDLKTGLRDTVKAIADTKAIIKILQMTWIL